MQEHFAVESAWTTDASAHDNATFFGMWLARTCTQLGTARAAVLLAKHAEPHAFLPVATWPDVNTDISHLKPACEQVSAQQAPMTVLVARPRRNAEPRSVIVGHPIAIDGVLHWIVAVELGPIDSATATRAAEGVHAACGWLVERNRRDRQRDQQAVLERLGLVMEAVTMIGEDRAFHAAAMNIVNELARRFDCDRVSLGLEQHNFIEVAAISNKASFDKRTDEIRLIADAMDEALDQAYPVIHPQGGEEMTPAPSHAALLQRTGAVSLCSIPLSVRGRPIGVVTLERHRGDLFQAHATEMFLALGDVLGALVELKRQADRGALRRLWDSVQDVGAALFGPRQVGVKFASGLAVLLLLFLSLADGDYRVAAKTVVEGAVQRAIVVPFDGFVAESAVRAGDVVKKGQALCRLDDKDLLLEQAKWEAEAAQLLPKAREAFASHDAALGNVLRAQIEQAQIQLKLTNERLGRTAIAAPFDGVVVSGDLSQLLGSPVEKGKVLFELAPLDAYRVILKVDERDVAALRHGQHGELAVSGIPDSRLPFTVKQITPVSTAEDGQNFFRIEAQMDGAAEPLRPGMQGVGKVAIGERKLIWIWTHKFIDWLQLALWNWLP